MAAKQQPQQEVEEKELVEKLDLEEVIAGESTKFQDLEERKEKEVVEVVVVVARTWRLRRSP